MPRHQAVLVGLVLLVSYAYFYQAGGWNQNSRFDLVRALIERGTPRIDAYETNTGDKAVVEGHTYTDKAPGQSLTALPPVALGEVILRAAGRDVGGAAEQSLLSYVATIWAAGLPTVAAALCLAWTARRLGSSAGGAGFVALVYGLATPAWAYATLFWGHALTAGCLMAALAAAVALRDAPKPMFGLVVGLAGGWAVVTEYPAAPATALVMALAVVHARRALAWVVLGALGSLAVLAVYNLAAFGSTLHVSYETVQGFAGMQQGLLGVTTPKRTVLQEILFGSFRGLLPLAPALALSPLGLGLLWRERGVRPVVLTITAIVVYYLLFNASYAYWHGGFSYGPRHLGACLPFMCLGLGQLWSRGDRLLRAGLSGLTAWGMALAGMAVSTTPMLPESVMSPITDIVWPTFARGELALNHDLYVVRPVAGVVSGGVLERGAWNLGQLAGLNGHASLLPLVLIWLGAALAWRAPGANVDARRSRSYHRLSVIASPRDPD